MRYQEREKVKNYKISLFYIICNIGFCCLFLHKIAVNNKQNRRSRTKFRIQELKVFKTKRSSKLQTKKQTKTAKV